MIQGFLFRRWLMAPGRAVRDLTTTSAHLLHLWGNHVAFRHPSFFLCEISELEEEWLLVTWTKLRDLRFCCCCCCGYVLVSVRVFQRNCNERLCVCVCVCVYTYIKRLGIKLLLVLQFYFQERKFFLKKRF